jgi:hypothetical protein
MLTWLLLKVLNSGSLGFHSQCWASCSKFAQCGIYFHSFMARLTATQFLNSLIYWHITYMYIPGLFNRWLTTSRLILCYWGYGSLWQWLIYYTNIMRPLPTTSYNLTYTMFRKLILSPSSGDWLSSYRQTFIISFHLKITGSGIAQSVQWLGAFRHEWSYLLSPGWGRRLFREGRRKDMLKYEYTRHSK